MSLPILFKIPSGTFSASSQTFFTRVMPRGVLGHDDVVKRMLRRWTSFTEVDFRGAIRLYEQGVMDAVVEDFAGGGVTEYNRRLEKGTAENHREMRWLSDFWLSIITPDSAIEKAFGLTSFALQLLSDPAVDTGGLLNGTGQFGRAADRSSYSQLATCGKNGINLL